MKSGILIPLLKIAPTGLDPETEESTTLDILILSSNQY